jgi:hypothetical protein
MAAPATALLCHDQGGEPVAEAQSGLQSPDHRSSGERSGAGEYALNAIDFDQTFSPVPARPPADAREFLYWITMNLD